MSIINMFSYNRREGSRRQRTPAAGEGAAELPLGGAPAILHIVYVYIYIYIYIYREREREIDR